MKREKREAKAAKIKAAAEAKEAERVAAQKAERQACVVWRSVLWYPLSTRRLTCACSRMRGCAGTGTAFMQLRAVVSKGLQLRSRRRKNQKTTGAGAKTRTQVSTSLQASTFRSQLMHTAFRCGITCGGWRTGHQHCVVPPCDQPHRAIQRRGPASVQPKQPCETASCSTPSRSPIPTLPS